MAHKLCITLIKSCFEILSTLARYNASEFKTELKNVLLSIIKFFGS